MNAFYKEANINLEHYFEVRKMEFKRLIKLYDTLKKDRQSEAMSWASETAKIGMEKLMKKLARDNPHFVAKLN